MMQRFKTTILLASILGILIAAAVGASIASNKKNNKKSEGGLFAPVNVDEISKIEIIKEGAKQELSKQDGRWVVSSSKGLKADQKAVEDMLNCVKEMNKEEIISANPEKKASFEVDEKGGIEAKLYKGEDILADFFVGKAGADFDSTYIRAASEDNVYTTKKYIRIYFDKSDFRDLAIFNFDKEKIAEISIDQSGKDAVILQKKDGAWKAQWYDKFAMDEDKVKNLLGSLSKLSARDILTDKSLSAAGLDNPKAKITAKLDDGSSETLNIGAKEGDAYFVKRSADDAIFSISESKAKELLKDKDDFSK